MQKPNHTVAPWTLHNHGSPARILGPDKCDALALVYLTDPKTRRRSPEFVANAHVMTAAPELLAALAAVVDWLDRDPANSPLGAKSGALAQSWAAGAFGEKVRAAIAKATPAAAEAPPASTAS